MRLEQLNFNSVDRPRMLESLVMALGQSERFSISVSFLRCSGVGLLIDPLRSFLRRGGRGRLLTSDYLNITQPEALEALMGLEGLQCRVHSSQRGFHPKFYTFGDKDRLWVGSSNISRGGLTDNLEANLLSQQSPVVHQALDKFEHLWNHPDVFVPSKAWLEAYAERQRRDILWPPPQRLVGPPAPNAAQQEALGRLGALRDAGVNKAAIIAAPGVGKTFLAAFWARHMGAKTVLFISHRLEHLTQSRATFEKVFVDGQSMGVLGGGQAPGDAQMIFASIQSLGGSRGKRVLERTFDLMVVDEFHHAAAPSYLKVLEATSPQFLLGLTATPERQDGHDVLRLCDHNIAYEVRLHEAINKEWLLPFHYFGVADDTVAWQSIPWRRGQFDPEELENRLLIDRRVERVLEAARERGFDGPRRATVGFCAGVRHARYMAQAFRERGLVARALVGEDALEERAAVLGQLADPHHPLEWLFVADLLNEGVDVPAINSLLFLRPTQSPTIFLQQLGRGLRLSPGCEVLTAIDFVGHHRNAWLPLNAFHDPRTVANISTRRGITPPSGCEIVLDEQTLAILDKVQRFVGSKKQRCMAAYELLRGELGVAPLPIDLWGRDDMPPWSDFRAAFGSWLEVRKVMEDAQPWEKTLSPTHPLTQLLALCERDWQQQRVYAYALLWGLLRSPLEPEVGYQHFFERFVRWQVEYKPLDQTKAWQTVQKKLGALVKDKRLVDGVFDVVHKEALLEQVLGRVRLTLEKDYRVRHGGVLRTPQALHIHRSYLRHEILNHFGVQYDPARHNSGVINLGQSTIIITKLDTSGAKVDYQYSNRVVDAQTFQWQSQNRQRRDNKAGRRITEHAANAVRLYLFVQRGSGVGAVYLGPVSCRSVEGDGPMTVTFDVQVPLSQGVMSELGVVLGTD